MENHGREENFFGALPGHCEQSLGIDMKKFPKSVQEQLKRTLQLESDEAVDTVVEGPVWEYTLFVHNSRGTKLSHEELMVELGKLGAQGWEHYDSYPDTRDRDMRLYHFKRRVH